MGITLDELVFDTANPNDGANVGSYVRSGDDGTQIGHVGSALKTEDTTAIALLTTMDADTSSIATDAGTLAGAVSGTEMQVDLVDAIGNWSVNAGAVDATTQRVHLSDESLAALEDITVTIGAANGANKTSTGTAGLTAVELAASPLADRASIIIQNNGSKDIFLGESAAVTTANGIKIPRGGSFEDSNAGPALNYFVISSAAGQDVRVLEKSAV
jgi:hypothetical protein